MAVLLSLIQVYWLCQRGNVCFAHLPQLVDEELGAIAHHGQKHPLMGFLVFGKDRFRSAPPPQTPHPQE